MKALEQFFHFCIVCWSLAGIGAINSALDLFEGKEVIGEITIVIKGVNKKNNSPGLDKILLKRELNDLINAGLKLSEASKYLAKKHNLKKSIIYDMY